MTAVVLRIGEVHLMKILASNYFTLLNRYYI